MCNIIDETKDVTTTYRRTNIVLYNFTHSLASDLENICFSLNKNSHLAHTVSRYHCECIKAIQSQQNNIVRFCFNHTGKHTSKRVQNSRLDSTITTNAWGGTWVFLGASLESRAAHTHLVLKKNSPKIDTPF